MVSTVTTATEPQHTLARTAAPTVTDDLSKGFTLGSLWLNTAAGHTWVCADATVGAAVWRSLGPDASRLFPIYVAPSTAYTLPTPATRWAWTLLLFDAGLLVNALTGVQLGGGAAIITTTATQRAGGFYWAVS